MGFFEDVRDRLINWFAAGVSKSYQTRANGIVERREYRQGQQRKQLTVKPGQADDNTIVNFTGLAVDRGVSMLFGKGVDFDFEDTRHSDGTEESTAQEALEHFIDGVWEDNQKNVLLHEIAENGAEAGLAVCKIVPNPDLEYGFELIAIDPLLLDIRTDPTNKRKALKFTIQWKTTNENGREIGLREVTEWIGAESSQSGYWQITNWMTDARGEWELLEGTLNWEYDFPPIVYCQNLPNSHDVWGRPDITQDVIELQDKINFDVSNINKIIRLFAHPQRYGVNLGTTSSLNMGPDDMPSFGNPAARIEQLAPVADLLGSQWFLNFLRQALFDITRTVDMSSMAEKIGALTNFGLRVLYLDASAKLSTKRELYGALIREINRRLQILQGYTPIKIKLNWPAILPEDELITVQADQIKLGMGIADKQTLAEENGYDWNQVQQRLAKEQQGQTDLGTELLNAFNRGGTGG
jgi:hypothetical protein